MSIARPDKRAALKPLAVLALVFATGALLFLLLVPASAATQQAKLTAGDGAAGDYFGERVSVDGDTALVGAVWDDDNGTNSGSAYVYVRSGTTWSQQAKLTAGDGAAGDWFGSWVSVDGDTALVGAMFDDDKGTDSGSAYVFVRSGTSWSQQAKLTASDGAAGDELGESASLDGNTALVGVYRDDDNGTDSGSAYVFVRSGTTWSQQAKLTAGDGAAGDQFGASVSVAGDAALLGARFDDDNGPDSGSAYVLVRSGTAWSQQAKLTAGDGAAGDQFGSDVSVACDTALLAAGGDDDNGTDSGSAYVFVGLPPCPSPGTPTPTPTPSPGTPTPTPPPSPATPTPTPTPSPGPAVGGIVELRTDGADP